MVDAIELARIGMGSGIGLVLIGFIYATDFQMSDTIMQKGGIVLIAFGAILFSVSALIYFNVV